MAIKELKTESTKTFKTISEFLQLLFNETSKKKKDLSLFATKLIEEITDAANYKRYNL